MGGCRFRSLKFEKVGGIGPPGTWNLDNFTVTLNDPPVSSTSFIPQFSFFISIRRNNRNRRNPGGFFRIFFGYLNQTFLYGPVGPAEGDGRFRCWPS